MKRAALILVISSMGLCNMAQSQSAKSTVNKYSGLMIGVSLISLQEYSLNNVIHSGPGFYTGVFLEKSKEKSIQRFELPIAANFLKSSFEDEVSSYLFNVSGGYFYLHNLLKNNFRSRFYLGGNVAMNTVFEYFDNWDQNHFYWLTSYSLGAAFRLELNRPKSKFQFEGNMPLISIISRPPGRFMYTQSKSEIQNVIKVIHENSGVATPDKHLSLNFSLRYSFQNTWKVKPSVIWHIQATKTRKSGSGDLKIMNYALGIELGF